LETPALLAIETPVVFPNPVGADVVTVKISLGADTANVRLQVYTTAYRKIIEKDYGPMKAGTGSANWKTLELVDLKGRKLANGVYYVVCTTAEGARALGKLVILK